MEKLANLEPQKVFEYFEEICSIPHGSGNMDAISSYCMDFAAKHSLEAVRDEANNVVIYKKATNGYENADTVILQGHLDMVCQKTEDCNIDFVKDGLDIYTDGDFIKARGTTLGADNGIAVAMIMAILASEDIEHPAIEAVFTTDEEIGLIGAGKLSTESLKGRKMINIDSEDPLVLTVSCAGGSDFEMNIPIKRTEVNGEQVTLSVRGLKGGHSGVEINSGRVNANLLMARILNYAKGICDFDIISIDGGDKGNAIPLSSTAKLVVQDDKFIIKINEYVNVIKEEISHRESGFVFDAVSNGATSVQAIENSLRDKLIFALLCAPNGVVEMSSEIEGLVETSLNLGILKTDQDKVIMHFALRSNKSSALKFLEDKLMTFSSCVGCSVRTFGHYPPWEYKDDSPLQRLYISEYEKKFGSKPLVKAIHAGLECGVFSSGIPGLDCISIGPRMHDIHTTAERLSISSTAEIYEVILNVLKNCR